jgi:Holliday junction resolvasome RuvABC ATP-dependent DNA helicase subunit
MEDNMNRMATPQQSAIWFFNPEDEVPPSTPERLAILNDPEGPFARFVGNHKAIKRLKRAVFAALGDPLHCCGGLSFALLGPSSTGKTTLARLFAEAVGLPFVEIHPKAINEVNDILFNISATLEKTETSDGDTLELQPIREGPPVEFTIPPCIVFIDEVHALKNDVVHGLLKATEKSDAKLVTDSAIADCSEVCWIIATTDRGLLFDAFDTRFTKIFLDLYSKAEIAKIVQLNYPEFDKEACELVAKYAGVVPREALAFAQEMKLEDSMSPLPGFDWERAARAVAEDMDIDEFGMTKQRLNILLKLVKEGPISKARLCDVAHCKIEELERFIMPALLTVTEDQDALVTVSSRGYSVTDAGVAVLKLRGYTIETVVHKRIDN